VVDGGGLENLIGRSAGFAIFRLNSARYAGWRILIEVRHVASRASRSDGIVTLTVTHALRYSPRCASTRRRYSAM
jgi:hypothetical protein